MTPHGCFDDLYECLNAFRFPAGSLLNLSSHFIFVSFTSFPSPDYAYYVSRLDSPFTICSFLGLVLLIIPGHRAIG
jgi:hypothetical protein